MPSFERTVDEYGILKDGIHYYASILRPYARAVIPGKHRIRKKLTLHYDYRDISKIHFIDPTTRSVHDIPYRNRGYPAVSRWELRAARKRIIDDENSAASEEKIFSAIQEMRVKAKDAELKSKAARRERERHRQNKNVSHEKSATTPAEKGEGEKSQSPEESKVNTILAPKPYGGIEIE